LADWSKKRVVVAGGGVGWSTPNHSSTGPPAGDHPRAPRDAHPTRGPCRMAPSPRTHARDFIDQNLGETSWGNAHAIGTNAEGGGGLTSPGPCKTLILCGAVSYYSTGFVSQTLSLRILSLPDEDLFPSCKTFHLFLCRPRHRPWCPRGELAQLAEVLFGNL